MEYRLCWAASSNISFRGHTDWMEWDDPEAGEEALQDALEQSPQGGGLPDGLAEVLEASGFEWWVETR